MRRVVFMVAVSVVAAACAQRTFETTATSTTTPTTTAPATTTIPATTSTTIAAPLVEFIAGDDALVLEPGPDGSWDSAILRFPNVVVHDERYHLFYEGQGRRGESFEGIGYATSEDGLVWVKHEANPIIAADGSGFDALAVARPVVVVDDAGRWVMYYAGVNEDIVSAVGVATADAPEGPWHRGDEPLVTAGPEGAWDRGMIIPDQLIDTGDELRLYYSGRDRDGGVARIGLATSTDGISWEKHNDPATDGEFAASDPVVFNDQSWDSRATWTPTIFPGEDEWVMIYNGFGNLGFATSADGIRWEKFDENPVHRARSLFHPYVLPVDDVLWVFYRNLDDETIRRLEGTLTMAP